MILKGLVFLIVLYSRVIYVFGNENELYWSWMCQNNTCIKTSTTELSRRTSLEVCKLLCGKYRTLWPLPTGLVDLGDEVFSLHPGKIKFDFSDVDCLLAKSYLQKVSKIFRNKLYAMFDASNPTRNDPEVHVKFYVASHNLTLNWETNESYNFDLVNVGPTGIEGEQVYNIDINSNTVFGARHALETLTQLTASYCPRGNSHRGCKKHLVMLSSAKVSDTPAYSHRGLLVDTSRHFIPVAAIKKTLDAMAMTKLNVFHWHATDTQSFSLEIPGVPQLARYGAYSPEQVYDVETIKWIIEYAKLRGIRVIIEMDGPAHAGNGWQWGKSHDMGDLAVCVNKKPWRNYCIQPPCGQLNPVNMHVYTIMKKIFSNLKALLPSGESLHLGGDEVFFPCWNSSDEIVNWMAENNLSNNESGFLDLWGIYQEKILKVFDEDEDEDASEVPVILWSSSLTEPNVIEKYLDKDRYIIETWLPESSPTLKLLLEKGYRVITSTKDKWYLDHGFWGQTVYHSWKAAYNNKLFKHDLLLGGEASMWSERVDEHSLEMKIWPRTAAVAERLWSDPKTNANDAERRFENFRERLVQNGIDADATTPYYCYQNEDACE